MKVTVCQLDNRADQLESTLTALQSHIENQASEFLLLPEMCFHDWLAADPEPDATRWQTAVEEHLRRIGELRHFGVAAALGTRPIVLDGGQRRNQAWLWTDSAGMTAVHDKVYLPDEARYWEARWYARGEPRFETCSALGLTIGVLICTEMWYLEWARHFARADAELLCIPRVTPHASVEKWLAGGQTAAVCAGAWCLSSNLWHPPNQRTDCGGLGWITSPEGDVLARTSEDDPFVTRDIDIEFARLSKSTYPRYVIEP